MSTILEEIIAKLRTDTGWWNGAANARAVLGPVFEERDSLARWKQEQLTVTAWWATIDDLCRKHSEIRLGDHVSAFALRMIRQRDEMATALREFKASLEQLPHHLAFGSEARAVIAVIIARCEQLAPTPLAPQPEPLAGLST